jgi:Nucleotidyltransferase
MSEQDSELEGFSKFIGAIEPWLDEVVLIGGWAHRLYRLHPLARKLEYLPLTTLDGDVAVPPRLKAQKSTVRQRLLKAGFREEVVGEDRPPAAHYHYGKGGGFYAEFLTPLVGSEYDRSGKRKATKEVGGISSQLLRYIEILMISPWQVARQRERIPIVAETFGQEVAPKLHLRRRAELAAAAERLFGKVDDAIREASQMASGRKLTAERLAETSQAGLKEVFTQS